MYLRDLFFLHWWGINSPYLCRSRCVNNMRCVREYNPKSSNVRHIWCLWFSKLQTWWHSARAGERWRRSQQDRLFYWASGKQHQWESETAKDPFKVHELVSNEKTQKGGHAGFLHLKLCAPDGLRCSEGRLLSFAYTLYTHSLPCCLYISMRAENALPITRMLVLKNKFVVSC